MLEVIILGTIWLVLWVCQTVGKFIDNIRGK